MANSVIYRTDNTDDTDAIHERSTGAVFIEQSQPEALRRFFEFVTQNDGYVGLTVFEAWADKLQNNLEDVVYCNKPEIDQHPGFGALCDHLRNLIELYTQVSGTDIISCSLQYQKKYSGGNADIYRFHYDVLGIRLLANLMGPSTEFLNNPTGQVDLGNRDREKAYLDTYDETQVSQAKPGDTWFIKGEKHPYAENGDPLVYHRKPHAPEHDRAIFIVDHPFDLMKGNIKARTRKLNLA